jgi:tRNA(fMet)-specific endonuclease VapC
MLDTNILPFDNLAAETYGQVRTGLERTGTPIGPLDTLIASHALSLGVTLVTNNEREFGRVAGSPVENWPAHGPRAFTPPPCRRGSAPSAAG